MNKDLILERIHDILLAESVAIMKVELTERFVDAVRCLAYCKSKIVTTGMGKAGHVANKIASTLCSTGSPAVFLHPGESEHGDLGVIGGGEVLIAFSKSGETREILEMIPLAWELGLEKVIAITSNKHSSLGDLADIIIDTGVKEEPCPIGLTPSASTTVMMAIGDALALVLMEIKGITRIDFGLRHHGGYLGSVVRNER